MWRIINISLFKKKKKIFYFAKNSFNSNFILYFRLKQQGVSLTVDK